METICCLEKKSLYYNYIKLLPKSYEQRRMKWYNFGNECCHVLTADDFIISTLNC